MSRQIGKTTRQMLDAPKNALYIWCNDILNYPRYLALYLGRDDLEIVGLSVLREGGGNKLKGREFTGVILDHAAKTSLDEWECYQHALARCHSESDAE